MAASLHRILCIFLSVLFSIPSFTLGNTFRFRRNDGVLLRAAIISDTHVTADFDRTTRFRLAVKDVSKHVRPDVFVIAGDVSDTGEESQWNAVTSVTAENLDVPYSLIAWGDHDTWNEGGFDASKELYLKNANAIMGTDHETVWFSEVIEGYTFIVMGSETDSVQATISDEQIDWVKEQLALARARNDNPVFVINHQPLSGTHHSPDNRHEDCFTDSAQSAKLQAALDEYKNVFYFSGHQHNGLNTGVIDHPKGYRSIEKTGENITSVNLPSFQFGNLKNGGYVFAGAGIVMDVYEDRIEFTGRNFELSDNILGFKVRIDLT